MMGNSILSLPLIAALSFLNGCGEDHSLLPRGQFILEVNEKYDAGEFELFLSDLSDSRCPKDVECIWAGAATTTLLIEPGNDTLKLCIGSCQQAEGGDQNPHTDTLLIAKSRYAITLLEVNPYPGTAKDGQSKEALFRLELVSSQP